MSIAQRHNIFSSTAPGILALLLLNGALLEILIKNSRERLLFCTKKIKLDILEMSNLSFVTVRLTVSALLCFLQ